MAKLILPPQSMIVTRRKAGLDKKTPGLWHFMKTNRKTLCGYLIPGLYDIETSTLGKIKGKELCQACWRFEKVESHQKQ